MTLGESVAAEVMKHLGPRDVQSIGIAMSALDNVSKEMVEATMKDFIARMQKQTSIGVGSDEYIRNVLTDALGEEKANAMIDRILVGGDAKGLESLKWMDPRSVVELIRYEHPQIMAIVLSYLDADHAAQVLEHLPDTGRADLLMRIAAMDSVQPAAMKELNEILEIQLRGGGSGGAGRQSAALGGIKCAAEILNFVDRASGTEITEQITEADAEVAEQIQDLMFTFDNLVEIDDRGIQVLLREVSTDNLVLALKGTDDAIQEKIFANMSSRAADMLRDDLEAKGPVKLSEVEFAQKEILVVARRLADDGTISLGGPGGEEMI
ncbi:MAG: flagellar motor switch protein FliG [Proteobacteria bacterium]|nr:MAG: flagellar motor switch protein FliG [Pseudomonadota bacterium]TDJ64929.1 MAG: flagellar motor switch protein FliG [Pseudomonadota bacterium]